MLVAVPGVALSTTGMRLQVRAYFCSRGKVTFARWSANTLSTNSCSARSALPLTACLLWHYAELRHTTPGGGAAQVRSRECDPLDLGLGRHRQQTKLLTGQ